MRGAGLKSDVGYEALGWNSVTTSCRYEILDDVYAFMLYHSRQGSDIVQQHAAIQKPFTTITADDSRSWFANLHPLGPNDPVGCSHTPTRFPCGEGGQCRTVYRRANMYGVINPISPQLGDDRRKGFSCTNNLWKNGAPRAEFVLLTGNVDTVDLILSG